MVRLALGGRKGLCRVCRCMVGLRRLGFRSPGTCPWIWQVNIPISYRVSQKKLSYRIFNTCEFSGLSEVLQGSNQYFIVFSIFRGPLVMGQGWSEH